MDWVKPHDLTEDEVEFMASDHGLQQLIGAALIDRNVRATLLESPLSLADQFDLTIPERRFVAQAQAQNLEHFALLVEAWVNGEATVRQLGEARAEKARLVG